MTNRNLYSCFSQRLPSNTDAVFLRSGRLVLRYCDIDSQSGKYLAVLKHCDVTKGERVVVQVEKSVEVVLLYLACLRAGAIFVPLNTAYTQAELDYFLKDAQPRVFICRPDRLDTLSILAKKHNVNHCFSLSSQGSGSFIDLLASINSAKDTAHCSDDDVAAILYTSGTTGRSKGAMITHVNLISNALVLHQCWQWQPGDVLLHALPIFHIHGLFVALHCALLNGSEVIFLNRFDPGRVIQELPNATVMMGVPTFYVRLLEATAFNRETCAGYDYLFVARCHC